MIALLIRVLCLLLISLVVCWADNVSVKVFTSKTPTNGVSGAIRNIGQSQHLLWLQLADSGGSCSTTNATVWLEASYDGTTYFSLTPRLIQLDGSKIGQAMATGIYPALRVNSLSNYVNCALTVWYSGSTDPVAFPQIPRLVQSGYVTSAASATSTTGVPVASNSQAAGRVVVYGFWAHNAGAAVSGELFFAPDNTCASILATVAVMNLGASSAPAIWHTSLVPYGYGAGGASLCWRLGGAGNATVYTVYRLE